MIYIINENMLSEIATINEQTQKYSVPCATEDNYIIIDIPEGWIEHEQFVQQNNLHVYVPAIQEIEL